jgi:hypothetical protein
MKIRAEGGKASYSMRAEEQTGMTNLIFDFAIL